MIEFREHDHSYHDQGRRVPSVTQVIGMLVDFGWVPQEILEWKSNLGRAVHLAIHLHELDDLDMASVDLSVIPYLEQWIKFKEQSNWTTWDTERIVYSRRFRYAGALDLYGDLDGPTIIDIKTVAVLHPAVGIQTAAYAEALSDELGKRIKNRYALVLSPVGYRLTPYTDQSDFAVFQACLTLHNWRKNHNAN